MSSQLAAKMVKELEASKEFFDRSTRPLEEPDSAFTPVQGLMTVAQQVAHTAHTLDWFAQGVTRPEGFDLDFAAHAVEINKVTSLAQARAWHDRAHKNFVTTIGCMSDAELFAPLPAGPVMGGAPKLAVVGAASDHTAHHRGVLTVYTRALGKTPPMPYMEM